jgi:hypothetical protein
MERYGLDAVMGQYGHALEGVSRHGRATPIWEKRYEVQPDVVPRGVDDHLSACLLHVVDHDDVHGGRSDRGGVADGKSLEAGVGIDRKAGAYRVSGNVLYANRIVNVIGVDRRDVTFVAAVDRSFARETRTVRAFPALLWQYRVLSELDVHGELHHATS